MMIETFSNGQAKDLEAEIEYPLHLKIQQAEAYLTKKYPTTKIHFFTNILRKQRAGQHTPFLVSPEGSMAYALMLNDFLLNPAAMICGITPMPFDLPKNFKILSSIGVFPEAEWTLKQNIAAEYRKKNKVTENDTGEVQINKNVTEKNQILEEETESFSVTLLFFLYSAERFCFRVHSASGKTPIEDRILKFFGRSKGIGVIPQIIAAGLRRKSLSISA